MIDFTKPIQTKDGRKARYLGKVNDGTSYQHVVVFNSSESSEMEDWAFVSDDGSAYAVVYHHSIVNVPVVVERFINLYGPASSGCFATRHDTALEARLGNAASTNPRQACIIVTYKDGLVDGVRLERA